MRDDFARRARQSGAGGVFGARVLKEHAVVIDGAGVVAGL